jgi:hypothetical protein
METTRLFWGGMTEADKDTRIGDPSLHARNDERKGRDTFINLIKMKQHDDRKGDEDKARMTR